MPACVPAGRSPVWVKCFLDICTCVLRMNDVCCRIIIEMLFPKRQEY